MNKADRIRLSHIRDATLEIVGFVHDVDRASLENNRQLVLAIIKDIEIIGEAANKISEDLKTKHPGIPWIDIIGMRHHLIHEYFDIDLEIVWKSATADVPQLLEQIQKILN